MCVSDPRQGQSAVPSALRAHERKQDHVANARPVQEDHAEPVDADAQAAGRRHRVLECPDEVVVHLGHRLLGGQAGELLAEELFLQARVVELGVGVGQLDALDEKLEPLGDRRVRRLALGERADRRGVVDDEDRPCQVIFDDGFEKLAGDDVGVLAGGRDAGGLGAGLDRREISGIDARRTRPSSSA